MRIRTCALLVVAVLSQSSYASEPQTPLAQYRAQSIDLRLPTLFGEPTLHQGGAELEFGYFGGHADEVFSGSPNALDAAETYSEMRIAGFVLVVAGLAALVTELVLLFASPETLVARDAGGERSPTVGFWALLGSGAVIGLVGTVVTESANQHLNRAVDVYNAELAQRLSAPRSVLLRLKHRF